MSLSWTSSICYYQNYFHRAVGQSPLQPPKFEEFPQFPAMFDSAFPDPPAMMGGFPTPQQQPPAGRTSERIIPITVVPATSDVLINSNGNDKKSINQVIILVVISQIDVNLF